LRIDVQPRSAGSGRARWRLAPGRGLIPSSRPSPSRRTPTTAPGPAHDDRGHEAEAEADREETVRPSTPRREVGICAYPAHTQRRDFYAVHVDGSPRCRQRDRQAQPPAQHCQRDEEHEPGDPRCRSRRRQHRGRRYARAVSGPRAVREPTYARNLHERDPGCVTNAEGNLSSRRSCTPSRPKASAGLSGTTWEAYGQDLEANLQDLHRRLRRGCIERSLA
jgi:hypothetical protein